MDIQAYVPAGSQMPYTPEIPPAPEGLEHVLYGPVLVRAMDLACGISAQGLVKSLNDPRPHYWLTYVRSGELKFGREAVEEVWRVLLLASLSSQNPLQLNALIDFLNGKVAEWQRGNVH